MGEMNGALCGERFSAQEAWGLAGASSSSSSGTVASGEGVTGL